jgi:cobalt-zinc-cadmium efflux system outer membrane protein
MKRVPKVFLSLGTALLAACASVPRDAGVSDIQQAVAARANQQVRWSAPATADDAQVRGMLQDGELTADKAVATAMLNNARLQVTLADLGIARADLLQASTIANPLFEAEYRFPADPFHAYEFRLAQSLVELLQLPRRRAIGRAAFDAAQMRVTSEVLRFGTDVRSAYFDLLAATQHVGMSRVNVESAKAAAELALKQHTAGNITDLDLENEQAMYEQAKLDLARAERDVLVAREAFVRGLGLRDTTADWKLPQSFPPLPAAELDQQQLEQLAATQRLDVAIVRREVEVAERQIPVARLAALGDIIADVHYQRDAIGTRTVGPGIELPIPIFNTGAAARNRAEAQWLKTRHLLSALLAESSSTLRAVRAKVVEARARVEYYRDVLLPRRTRIVELTKLEHNAMLLGVFQLLQAKQNEADARQGYIDAQREYWSARAELDRALNGISADTAVTPAIDQRQTKRAGITRGGH